MGDRPERLYFVGERDKDGNPLEFWGITPSGEGIPARDLEAEDIDRLDHATIKLITGPRAGGHKALYQVSRPAHRDADDALKAAKPATSKAPAKKVTIKKAVAKVPEPEPVVAFEPAGDTPPAEFVPEYGSGFVTGEEF